MLLATVETVTKADTVWTSCRYKADVAAKTAGLYRGPNERSGDSSEYRGWWRITETSQWVNDGLDDLGAAMLSLTGHGDRLRMHCLLAYVNCPTRRTGVSFSWEGAWAFDQVTGSGRVTLGRDGRLKGAIKIKGSDGSTFVAERSGAPA